MKYHVIEITKDGPTTEATAFSTKKEAVAFIFKIFEDRGKCPSELSFLDIHKTKRSIICESENIILHDTDTFAVPPVPYFSIVSDSESQTIQD